MQKISWYALAAGIISIIIFSTSGVATVMITVTDAYMKSSWRLQIAFLASFLFFLFNYPSKSDQYKSFARSECSNIIISGVSSALFYSLWALSFQLTTFIHTFLLSSCSPIILVVFYLFTCKPVNKLEVLGVTFGCLGVVIMCFNFESTEKNSIFGDGLAFICSVMIAVHLQYSDSLYKKGDYAFLTCLNFIGAVFCLGFCVANQVWKNGIEGFYVLFNSFGYVFEVQGLAVVYLGIFVGFVGGKLFYYFLGKSSPLISSIFLLFEPVIGSIFGWALGYQDFPSVYTWIGGFLVFVSNLLCMYAKLKTEVSEPLLSELKKIDDNKSL